MDDIWASYYVTSKKYKVVYANPTVYQKRNYHNLMNDFKMEDFDMIDVDSSSDED